MNIEQYITKDYNHVFGQLQDYMLNSENIQKIPFFVKTEILKYKTKQNEMKQHGMKQHETKDTLHQLDTRVCVSPPLKEKEKENNPRFFYPKEKDTLFWCFYIMKHGLLHYQMLHNKNIVFEKNIKIEYVEKLRKEKQQIKPYKFASLHNIENDLVNENKIDAKTFLTLCVLENMNVVFIKRKTYYELSVNDNDEYFVVQFIHADKFGFQQMNKIETEKYKKDLFQIENIDKPIKSITYYKVEDLINICTKLGIEFTNTSNGKKKPKKELYENIVQQL